MRWLKAVSVLALRVRGLLGTVRPTPPAGPASPEPPTQTGSSLSALDTSPLHQPALTPLSPSNGHAPSTSTEPKHGSVNQTALAQQPLTVAGSKSRIPAHQRLQLAKSARKHVKRAASQIKAAAKRTPAKAPAPTPTASPSGDNGN
jgi:hypothetical protein